MVEIGKIWLFCDNTWLAFRPIDALYFVTRYDTVKPAAQPGQYPGQ